jgi:hypothetical protein
MFAIMRKTKPGFHRKKITLFYYLRFYYQKINLMRHLLSFLLPIFLSVSVQSQIVGEAVMEFVNDEHDLGKIQEGGGVVIYSFEFRNSGTAPLIIANINSSCSCTTSAWTKDPIAPEENGFIKVQFDPTGRSGTINETIHVQSNAKNPSIFLTIKGTIVAGIVDEKLEYKIGALSVKSKQINLGYINKGDTAVKTLLVANYTKKPMKVELTDLPLYVDAFVNPSILKPGGYGNIVINYYSNKIDDWDYVIDRIGIIINGKKDGKAKLAVTVNIREDFSNLTAEQFSMAPVAVFSSSTQSFDTIANNKLITTKYLLKNQGQSDLIIHAVKPSCGCTAVKPEKNILAPGDSASIEVVFSPIGRSGEFNKVITVITNDPKAYKQYLWLKGYIKN